MPSGVPWTRSSGGRNTFSLRAAGCGVLKKKKKKKKWREDPEA